MTPESQDLGKTILGSDQTRRFLDIVKEITDLHIQKSQDYGTNGDHYRNFRGSEEMGIEAWKGAFIRLCDKVQRIKKFAKDGKLTNEGVIDSFRDLAVYAIICEILYKETLGEPTQDRKGR